MRSRNHYACGVAVGAILWAACGGAMAQAQPVGEAAGREAPAGTLDEVVVTGSRIMRDGFTAPTPTTVMGAEDIARVAAANIADVVNLLPAVAGSQTGNTNNSQVSQGTGGQNILNLRGLGQTRTLVLMDGRRIVPTTGLGTTDANNLPSQLVKRVDVVTGGASASYGSDAVAGVVNYVLDSSYSGFKGEINGGISSRSDGAQRGATFTYGAGFLEDRGHVLLSVGADKVDGIRSIDPDKRKWYKGIRQMQNPACVAPLSACAQPVLLTYEHVNLSTAAPGGVITAGPLRGTSFGPGGIVIPFQYGNPVIGTNMAGGQFGDRGASTNIQQNLQRKNFFGKASYEFSDTLSGFVQFMAGHSKDVGSTAGMNTFTLNVANPYIPASVAAALRAAGQTTISVGVFGDQDYPRLVQVNRRKTKQFTVGLEGKAFGDWSWDAYYQYGETDLNINDTSNYVMATRNSLTVPFNAAIDVIVGPNGQPVCRAVATIPNCLPLNILGTGVQSQAALDAVYGTSTGNYELTQQVAEFSIHGEPFTLPAGKVSFVAGLGWRRNEEKTGYIDPSSLANLWFTANWQPTDGAFNVKEAFAEALVPVFKDAPFAKSLDLDGAVRVTDYSTSGTVTTWKIGVNYRPMDDVLIRGNRSRDIRAAGLSDLYAGGNTNTVPGAQDPKYGNLTVGNVSNAAKGNPNLDPEVADSYGIGAVYQPSWLTGFNISFDYYKIKIKDGIATLAPQILINDCFSGVHPEYCEFVTRGPGLVGGVARPDTITNIVTAPLNFSKFQTTGFDIEVSYRRDLSDWFSDWDASLSVRSLATHVIKFSQDVGTGAVNDYAGVNAGDQQQNTGFTPDWRVNTQVTYDQGPLSLSATWRWISDGVFANAFFTTPTGPLTTDNNHIPAVSYLDLGASYRFEVGDREVQVFARVNNALDKAPPVSENRSTSPFSQQFNPFLYDAIGRYYRAGVRFEF